VRQDADASDLTQKVQWRMDQGFARFRGESVAQLLAWVRQIAARVCLDHLDGRPPAVPLPPDPVCPRPAAGSSLLRAEEAARLAKALERLPEHYRRVIEARLQDGLPCVEIGRRMGRTAEWVRIVSKRAVERLRQDLGERP
jgi:RNA polymerase sigma-70 factor (ECF subfamily)